MLGWSFQGQRLTFETAQEICEKFSIGDNVLEVSRLMDSYRNKLCARPRPDDPIVGASAFVFSSRVFSLRKNEIFF